MALVANFDISLTWGFMIVHSYSFSHGLSAVFKHIEFNKSI